MAAAVLLLLAAVIGLRALSMARPVPAETRFEVACGTTKAVIDGYGDLVRLVTSPRALPPADREAAIALLDLAAGPEAADAPPDVRPSLRQLLAEVHRQRSGEALDRAAERRATTAARAVQAWARSCPGRL